MTGPVKRLQEAAAKAETMFRNFSGEDPGACLTAGSPHAEACEMADELREANAGIDNWRTFLDNCARPGDVANVILERDSLQQRLDGLLKVCREVYEDPYSTCLCADKLKTAIEKAGGKV